MAAALRAKFEQNAGAKDETPPPNSAAARRAMFEQGNAAEASVSPAGSAANRRAMFEQGNDTPASVSKRAAFEANETPKPINRKAMFENNTAEPANPGPGTLRRTGSTVASPRGKKPAPNQQQANTIFAYLKARQSEDVVKRRRITNDIEIIQREFRHYLNRTTGTRDMIRQRRKEKIEQYKAKLTTLIGAARQNGMEICIFEAKERFQITRRYVQAEVQVLQMKERQLRNDMEGEQLRFFDQLIKEEAPKILIPGTLENSEFNERNHIAKYSNFCWAGMMNDHTIVVTRGFGMQRTPSHSVRQSSRKMDTAS